MNIKVAAFTVSEKSSNIYHKFYNQYGCNNFTSYLAILMNMLIKNQSQAIQILTDVANILDTYNRIGNV